MFSPFPLISIKRDNYLAAFEESSMRTYQALRWGQDECYFTSRLANLYKTEDQTLWKIKVKLKLALFKNWWLPGDKQTGI